MDSLVKTLNRSGFLADDVDYHLVRASMVIIFLFFGYQKWFEYEAQVLIPYISNGPLIFWMYPVFGIRGASGSSAFRSGCSARSCSWASGTRDWGFSAPPARLSLS
jgi:uncharacterized membrane protein YkgB